jgi:ABC-2 type transport system permease protein
MEDFTHGVIDTRQVFFYFTGAILTLLLSILGVEAKILNS